jgi:hypothetical protein
MITIQTTGGIAYVPDNWHEVTLEGFYLAFCEQDLNLLIEGESTEAIELAKPYTCLSFDNVAISPDCIDVSAVVAKFPRMRWHKFLQLEFAINEHDAGKIVGLFDNTFTAEQLNAMPCPIAIQALTDLLNAYHGFLSNYKMEAMITDEMINAGIEQVNQLGAWISIMELGEAYGLDPDVIVKWNIEKVYTDLFVRYTKAEYSRKLQEQNKK